LPGPPYNEIRQSRLQEEEHIQPLSNNSYTQKLHTQTHTHAHTADTYTDMHMGGGGGGREREEGTRGKRKASGEIHSVTGPEWLAKSDPHLLDYYTYWL